MMKRSIFILSVFLLALSFSDCGNGKSKETGNDGMSELEQLKYDNALKKFESVCAEANEAVLSGDENGQALVSRKIRSLKYDFNSAGMSDEIREKCSALKARIDSLKGNPDAILRASGNEAGSRGTLLSKRSVRLSSTQRFPYYFNEGDKVVLKTDCQGMMNVSFYDINRQARLKLWRVNRPTDDSITIASAGIYMLELKPSQSEAVAEVSLSFTGTSTYRPRVREKQINCRAGEFLAETMDSIIIEPVFGEPVKLGLRGNLKSAFSGKSRSVVSIPVPAGCDALLYSLRISTNERTVSADGKFPERLSVASHKVKLFGVNVYESNKRNIIDHLLGDTRPPREEDAFCNMYVFGSPAEAKKFQDGTESSGSYKYDVDQSKMGTQSCNGRLHSKGGKIIYLGFENERLRYDNYIWLEVAALKHVSRHVRPIYTTK